MSAMTQSLTGAALDPKSDWNAINWPLVDKQVWRMQMRIAKAVREKRYGKVKSLQRLLAYSIHGKLMAVKRVALNSGSKTPGVDGVIWNTPRKRMKAVFDLNRNEYKTQPLRRIYIPKRNGQKRPLSIPTMKCRAMQALHLLGLEPVAETLADPNSYGFRPKRSTADAIEHCFKALSNPQSAQWVLEGDIKSCFDKINHDWLLANVPMDKQILKKWLKAGYIEDGALRPTDEGTPQGGVISSDDFIVTGDSKELLENEVRPAIQTFLGERGLILSIEKSKITHIDDGFDFLGFNVRKYKGKLLIKPSPGRVKDFLSNIRRVIKKHGNGKTEVLIHLLNLKIRGWANHYRHVVSKKTFNKIDHHIFEALWRWALRRHPKKGRRWIVNNYFRSHRNDNWVFFAKVNDPHDGPYFLDLIKASKTPFRRHVKIRSDAHPYDEKYREYFYRRELRKRKTGSG
jgi:RNA-directed DNA polymerase